MKNYCLRCIFFTLLIIISQASTAVQKEQNSNLKNAHPISDDKQIETLLKNQFDRPNSPLTVAPIIIDGNHAVAGWTQDGKGGRAYLSKTDIGWMVRMCSGESLTKSKTYTSFGLSESQASKLTSRLLLEEKKLGNDTSKLLSSFEGTVFLDGSHSHHPTIEDTHAQKGHHINKELHNNKH